MNESIEPSHTCADREFFAALPLCGRAAILHQSFRASLIKSLAQLLAQLERTLRLERDTLVSLMRDLDVGRRFAPALYAVHWLLVQALETRDSQASIRAITFLRGLGENAYVYPSRLFGTLDGGLVEEAIRDYLIGPEGPRDDLGGLPEIFPLSSTELSLQSSFVADAAHTIHLLDNALGEEFEEYVSEIRLFRGKTVRGITSVRVFGSVHLRIPEPELSDHERLIYYVDHFTHETSHLQLHTFMTHDPLIVNDDSQRFSAPIRPDPRPLYGIFHAVFVLSRIVRILGLWHEQTGDETILGQLRVALARFDTGVTTLEQHATLTNAGEEMFQNITAAVSLWNRYRT